MTAEASRLILPFFLRRWDEIETVIDYDSDWESEMPPEHLSRQRETAEAECIEYSFAGVLISPAMRALAAGEVAKSMDDFGRKFIFVQTRLGICTVFVASKDIHKGYLTVARSRKLRLIYPGPPQASDASDLAQYIGSPNGLTADDKTVINNLGVQLEEVYKLLSNPNYNPKSIFIIKDKSGKPV